MENEFEEYVDDNRAAFEKGTPPPRVWQHLESGLAAYHANKQHKKMVWMRWAAAAMLLLVAGAAVMLFPHGRLGTTVLQDNNSQQQGVKQLPANRDSLAINRQPAAETGTAQNVTPRNNAQDDYSRSITYYQAAVKLKEQQVSKLLAAAPELNRDFKKAIDDLDEIVRQLQASLPESINKEKILQGIIKNLQMQENVLNSQLEVLKTLQNNSADEQKNG